MVESLKKEMLSKGYKTNLVSVNRLQDIRNEFETLHSQYLDETVYGFINGFYNFDVSNHVLDVKSIIVVASPCSQVQINVCYHDTKSSLTIPPTYIDYVNEPILIEKELNKLLQTNGFLANRVHTLPEKLLAVRSGLGSYGRNNICYVPEMGSFVLISVYYSDLPCEEDSWQEVNVMKSCYNCTKCMDQCPTGAISNDSPIIHAQTCITYFNEFTNSTFPEWIHPSSHNAVIGCMKCQICCPHNSKFLGNIVEMEEFSEEETILLLSGIELKQLSETIVRKLERLNLITYYPLLSRNLKAILPV